MREMKDSSVSWIGEIPTDWSLIRFKDKYRSYKEIAGEKYSEYQRLALTLNGVIKRPKYDSEGLQPKELNTYQILRENEFIFKMIDLQNISTSRVGLSSYTGLVSPAYIKFAPRAKDQYPKFIYYFLMSMYYNCVFNSLGGDGVRSALNATDMGVLIIPYPEIDIQKKIVSAIAEKVTAIDALIANQQAQIEKLKQYKQSLITEVVTKGLDPAAPMKDSGKDYYGDIPSHWKLLATKRLFEIESGATPKSDNLDFFDGDIPWITPADYKTDDVFVFGGRRNLTKKGLESCSTTLIPAGSIVFSKRAPIGAVAINANPLCTNQGCLSCIPKTEDNVKYYYYVMSSMVEQYNLLGSGTTFKEISAQNFSNFTLPQPPIDEQQSIVELLDNKCRSIQKVISLKILKIEKLTKYKKSLIYEYVTGKKEVV